MEKKKFQKQNLKSEDHKKVEKAAKITRESVTVSSLLVGVGLIVLNVVKHVKHKS